MRPVKDESRIQKLRYLTTRLILKLLFNLHLLFWIITKVFNWNKQCKNKITNIGGKVLFFVIYTLGKTLPHQWSGLEQHWSWWLWVKCGSQRDGSVYRIWTSRLGSDETRSHQRPSAKTLQNIGTWIGLLSKSERKNKLRKLKGPLHLCDDFVLYVLRLLSFCCLFSLYRQWLKE